MKIAIITNFKLPTIFIEKLSESFNMLDHDVTLFGSKDLKIPRIGRLITCKNDQIILTQYSYLFKIFDIIHDFSQSKEVFKYCQSNNIKSVSIDIDELSKSINNIKSINDIEYCLDVAKKYLELYEKTLNGEKICIS